MDALSNCLLYLAPTELSRNAVPPRRVMVIGSYLTEEWHHIWTDLQSTTQIDHFLFNELDELPEAPPGPPEDYAFQVIQLPSQDVYKNGALRSLPWNDPETAESLFRHAQQLVLQMCERATAWTRRYRIPTYLAGYQVPQINPMGRYAPRFDLRNIQYFTERLNETLANWAQDQANVYYVDWDGLTSIYGKKYMQGDMVWETEHGGIISNFDQELDAKRLAPMTPMTEHYVINYIDPIRSFWFDLVAMYRTLQGLDTVKAVVIDLDDTLWRGVARDDGFVSNEGWVHGFVEALMWLKQRGIMLVTLSKNDEAWIREHWTVFTKIPWDAFVMHSINWDPKPPRMVEIAKALNIRLDSIVYIDDNPVEVQAMREALPDVRVLDPDPYYWKRTLLWSAETQQLTWTDESLQKTRMMQGQLQRDASKEVMEWSEFLQTLKLQVTVTRVKQWPTPQTQRLWELFQKTNQFNTTGRRYSLAEFEDRLQAGDQLYMATAQDQWTTYGIIGAVWVKDHRIDHLILSCRVMGLGVEHAMVAAISQCSDTGLPLEAVWSPSGKNDACHTVWSSFRWHLDHLEDSSEIWTPGSDTVIECPSHIQIVIS